MLKIKEYIVTIATTGFLISIFISNIWALTWGDFSYINGESELNSGYMTFNQDKGTSRFLGNNAQFQTKASPEESDYLNKLLLEYYNVEQLSIEGGPGLWNKQWWLSEYGYNQAIELLEGGLDLRDDYRSQIPTNLGSRGRNLRISDQDFLELVQKDALRWFLKVQHPRTGLFLDSGSGIFDSVRELEEAGTAGIASTGFGLTALIIGLENGWDDLVTKGEAKERIMEALRTIRKLQKRQKELIELPSGEYKLVKREDLDKSYVIEDGFPQVVYKYQGEKVELVTNWYSSSDEDLEKKEELEKLVGKDKWNEAVENWEQYGKWGVVYRYMAFKSRVDQLEPRSPVELSTVDMALFLIGAIAAGEYFKDRFGDESIKRLTQEIWAEVDWSWFMDEKGIYYMAWKPHESNPTNLTPKGFTVPSWDVASDETLLIDFLSIGNPDIKDSQYRNTLADLVWNAWERPWGVFEDGEPFVYTPQLTLWASQYGHAWIDFRDKKSEYHFKGTYEAEGEVDWWENSQNFTLAFIKYGNNIDELSKTIGPNSWGISSSFRPTQYLMNKGLPYIEGIERYGQEYPGVTKRGDKAEELPDTNVTPSAPAGSIVFTPINSLMSLRYLYLTQPRIWDEGFYDKRKGKMIGGFGFRDSFDLDLDPENYDRNWWSPVYAGLGQGIMMLMLENFRSGMVWEVTMNNEYIKEAMLAAGFDNADYAGEVTASEISEPVLRGQDVNSIIEYSKEVLNELSSLAFRATTDLSAGKAYLENNDRLYDKGLQLLDRIDVELLPKDKAIDVLALRFVFAKNQFQYELQKETFRELALKINSIENDDLKQNKIDEIAKFIYSYDYEGKLTQAIDMEIIKEDLGHPFRPFYAKDPNIIPFRTPVYPNLEIFLHQEGDFYPLFIIDSANFVYWLEKAGGI